MSLYVIAMTASVTSHEDSQDEEGLSSTAMPAILAILAIRLTSLRYSAKERTLVP